MNLASIRSGFNLDRKNDTHVPFYWFRLSPRLVSADKRTDAFSIQMPSPGCFNDVAIVVVDESSMTAKCQNIDWNVMMQHGRRTKEWQNKKKGKNTQKIPNWSSLHWNCARNEALGRGKCINGKLKIYGLLFGQSLTQSRYAMSFMSKHTRTGTPQNTNILPFCHFSHAWRDNKSAFV